DFLSLATGYTISKCEMTGVVMDAGDGTTHVVPVADGYVIRSSIKSIPIVGRDLTLFVKKIMWERGENKPREDSLEFTHKVKEAYCYTCYDILKLSFRVFTKKNGKHEPKPEKPEMPKSKSAQ
ncbi:hypothetical protein KI387_021818, partial [Taxus chinensis]